MGEVLFEDRRVRVTRALVAIGDASYPTRGITSVRVVTAPRSHRPAMFLIFGLGLLMTALVFAAAALLAGGDANAWSVVCCVGAPGSLMTGLGLWGGSRPDSHAVIIGTAGGEQRALTTTDARLAAELRQAIEQAIGG